MTTYRELADRCCESCRVLEGSGPWCCMCGIEMPGASAIEWFTVDVCVSCSLELQSWGMP